MSSKKQAAVTTSAPVVQVQAPEFTIANQLTELKAFVEEHQIPVTGHKGHKASYIAAITAHFAPQIEAVVEVVEPLSINAVEPAALVVETAAVEVHAKLISPQAINGYRAVLRGVIWCGVAIVLVVGLAYTLAALAWDAIDGEPALVYWVKRYAKTPRGRLMRRSVARQWRAVRAELGVVVSPFAARAKEVRAIVRVGGQRVFGGGVINN